MRLKRLELQGFKSFLDRTILTFEPGVTGVVGPNGCGKSNIVDAIMWVMGEQSPKHLRGDNMTDIIFNGSDTRAPTSMAEVSLVMDRQGVALAPQFAAFDRGDEISITRRIYRDGTGEFFINKVACRLRDIHELFMDTGVGRRAYSIIEQGQIDRMINVKPEDRRHLFEEVAGITKYKAKRKEAEKKLELTRANILRIQDIIVELEKQIRSLKIQATRARKYKEIKTELETADLYLLGQELTRHREVVSELSAARENLINERAEVEAQFAQADASVTELEIVRIDQERRVSELDQREREVLLQIERLESQTSLFEERKRHLLESIESLDEEQTEKEAAALRLQEEESTLAQSREEAEANLLESDRKIGEWERELERAQTVKQQYRQTEIELSRQISQLGEKALRLHNQLENAESRSAEIAEGQASVAIKLDEAESVLGAHRERLSQTDLKITDCQQRNLEAERTASDLSEECQTTSQRLSQAEEDLFQKRGELQSKRSRLESLVELQTNLEGYSPTAKEIFSELKGMGLSVTPFAEAIQPEAGLEDHLELLLGNDMNLLVVPSRDEAERLAETIEQRNLERVSVTSLEHRATRSEIPTLSNAVPLLTKIKVAAGFETVAERLLGGVYLCDDKATVLSLSREWKQFVFLSQQSQIIAHGDDVLSSGSTQGGLGVFARRREIEELETLCSGLQTEADALNTQREQWLHRLEEQERLRTEWKEKLSAIHIESVEHRKERERCVSELMRAERDVQSLREETERLSRQRQECEVRILSSKDELLAVRENKENSERELARIQDEMQAAHQRFDEVMHSINEVKISRSGMQERLTALAYQLDKVRLDLNQLRVRLTAIDSQRDSDREEVDGLEQEAVQVMEEKGNRISERNRLVGDIADAKEMFQETCTRLDDLRRAKDDLQDRKSDTLEKFQEVELKLAHEEAELSRIRSLSEERYHREVDAIAKESKLTGEQLPMLVSQLEVTWDLLLSEEQVPLLQEHVKSLREKLERYGEVNLTAISEFDEVQKRYDFLMAQKVDLETSIATLEAAIIKIDESTKQRFEETFTAVNTKFREIFPILFNGGKAELTLTNPENLLESGVDVMAQPPGKRLQSITLLSGGEKALTAVSLILAIFARKPSPFCLLDEVDAPLDDANVSRFNTVIRKMSEKTQFIVITHNKKTMEIAEALYGVTMERAGISKMTSVQMH